MFMIKREEGNKDVFPTFTGGLVVVWDKLFIKTVASKRKKKEEHLLLSCGAGVEPASTVVSEAGHRAFVSSCCHSLTEERCSSRPQVFFFSILWDFSYLPLGRMSDSWLPRWS